MDLKEQLEEFKRKQKRAKRLVIKKQLDTRRPSTPKSKRINEEYKKLDGKQ